MRKIGIIAVLSLMALALAAVPAFAQNPHFLSATTQGINGGGDLTVNFRIAGLGNDIDTVTITLTGDATAVYACQNRGGNFPEDPKKQTEVEQVQASGTFPVHNGSARGSLTLLDPGTTLDCPGSQRVVLASIEYENVTLTGGGDTEVLGDFGPRVFFPEAL
jgi:hypothetical protein